MDYQKDGTIRDRHRLSRRAPYSERSPFGWHHSNGQQDDAQIVYNMSVDINNPYPSAADKHKQTRESVTSPQPLPRRLLTYCRKCVPVLIIDTETVGIFVLEEAMRYWSWVRLAPQSQTEQLRCFEGEEEAAAFQPVRCQNGCSLLSSQTRLAHGLWDALVHSELLITCIQIHAYVIIFGLLHNINTYIMWKFNIFSTKAPCNTVCPSCSFFVLNVYYVPHNWFPGAMSSNNCKVNHYFFESLTLCTLSGFRFLTFQ